MGGRQRYGARGSGEERIIFFRSPLTSVGQLADSEMYSRAQRRETALRKILTDQNGQEYLRDEVTKIEIIKISSELFMVPKDCKKVERPN